MYLPHTQQDVDRLLKQCGVNTLDDLFADVPAELKMKGEYALPKGMSEQQVADFITMLSEQNTKFRSIFAGAGFYDRYTPALVPALMSRSEYATAYTPYQPEISQGTLQYIFEYQTMIADLTGLEVSNASMYDSTTATAEAMMMMVSAGRKRNRVLVSATVNPLVMNVITTYAKYHGIDLEVIPERDGVTDLDVLRAQLSAPEAKTIAGVILPQPNFYGIVEDFTGIADAVHAAKALLTVTGPAMPLAVLRSPAEWGADIACGDAQSLGMPLNFGGPYLGYMSCTKALMRKIPGRIVGATTDARGNRVFVLTLQAREQHIRRNKATSNICSNQGMMALLVDVYVSLLGPRGLEEANRLSHDGAVYLCNGLTSTGKLCLAFPDKPFLNEFLLVGEPAYLDRLEAVCMENDILPGVRVAEDRLLVAVTERQTRQELDKYINSAKHIEV